MNDWARTYNEFWRAVDRFQRIWAMAVRYQKTPDADLYFRVLAVRRAKMECLEAVYTVERKRATA